MPNIEICMMIDVEPRDTEMKYPKSVMKLVKHCPGEYDNIIIPTDEYPIYAEICGQIGQLCNEFGFDFVSSFKYGMVDFFYSAEFSTTVEYKELMLTDFFEHLKQLIVDKTLELCQKKFQEVIGFDCESHTFRLQYVNYKYETRLEIDFDSGKYTLSTPTDRKSVFYDNDNDENTEVVELPLCEERRIEYLFTEGLDDYCDELAKEEYKINNYPSRKIFVVDSKELLR